MKALLGPAIPVLSQMPASFGHPSHLWQRIEAVRGLKGGRLSAASTACVSPDLKATRFPGRVESESSTAWCGANAVIADNIGTPGAPHAGKLFLTWSDLGRRVTAEWHQFIESHVCGSSRKA